MRNQNGKSKLSEAGIMKKPLIQEVKRLICCKLQYVVFELLIDISEMQEACFLKNET